MTQTQINRYHIIMKSIERKMTVAEAAVAMGISERQVKRIRNGVREKGAAFLIHKNKGRPSPHALLEEDKQKIREIYQSEIYNGSNFLHFSQLLEEEEKLKYSYSTVHRVLTDIGIQSPKKRRRIKSHRSRKRKAQEGLLNQMDASPHKWFGGNAMLNLHGGIDDATGKITGLYMTKHECLHGYYEVVRQTIEQNGIPTSAYVDRHTIFRSPNAEKITIEEQLDGKHVADTQFGRAMKELGVNLIYARTAQAKGRIERLWETLQSRLVIEFRIRGIKTVEDANMFLTEYIPKFNERFAVEPELTENVYIPNTLDLSLVLSVKNKRIVDSGGVFSFNNHHWKILGEGLPGKKFKVEVIASTTRGLLALYKGKVFDVAPYHKPKKAVKVEGERKPPSKLGHHSHGNWIRNLSPFSSDLVDMEIRKMLEDIFLSKYA